jgi:16S rRNA (guanine966-N2)-methyltransferase
MRIIAGKYRGRRLETVNDLSVRPATDRVRQTIFDMLTSRVALEGADVLDLFAGSGSLGFEALSRGARHVTFVENNRHALPYLQKTAQTLGCTDMVSILPVDALFFVDQSRESYSLVFADPPYAFSQTQEIPVRIFQKGLLRPEGFLVIEHAHPQKFESTEAFVAGPEKRFGRTLVTFFQQRNQE